MGHIENMGKILTYIQSCPHSPSITEVAKATKMHHDTAENILRLIDIAQNEINRIEMIKTKSSEVVNINRCHPLNDAQIINAKLDRILKMMERGDKPF